MENPVYATIDERMHTSQLDTPGVTDTFDYVISLQTCLQYVFSRGW